MKTLFELSFRDQRKLNAFIKTCEAMSVHSDTALLKVNKRGVYILLSDFESLCCLEVRLTDNIQGMLKIYCKEYTVKILLDSLTNILRQVAKNKHSAILCSDVETPKILLVREVVGQSHRLIATYPVTSTEHRARVYHVISTRQFRKKSKNYVQFRIPNVELNKIITMQSIISGNNGGVGELIITPIPDDEKDLNLPKNRCDIRFFMNNNSGGKGGVTIHTHMAAETVPIQNIPLNPIHSKYFLTYLKRSQNLFTTPLDLVTIYVSERGILIQTDSKDNHSVVIFIADVSDEDMDSYT